MQLMVRSTGMARSLSCRLARSGMTCKCKCAMEISGRTNNSSYSFSINMANPPLKVASGATSTNIAYKPSGDHAQEGAFIAKNGNYHYLFFSVGKCCGYDASRPATGQEYKIQVCRSTSATSGFVDKAGVKCSEGGGTTVLESHGWVYGPGGQGVYYDPSAGPVLYYHYVDTRIGYADGQKQFGINKIDFSSGWPVV